ncbi:hypothetical protein V8E54_002479, partial [Elaphomyces granulatus]
VVGNLDNFHLDILGQQPRVNRLYTPITFCFPFPDGSSYSQLDLIHTLTKGIERLSANFPWVAGKVVNEKSSFKIKPFKNTPRLVVKEFRSDCFPSWDAVRQANFPFSMLDESLVAPCKTLTVSDESAPELPVFLIQANFITGGLLLLTFSGQHMTGLGQVIHLLAKACCNEPFTPSELSVGNMDRTNIIPLLDNFTPGPELDHQILKDTLDKGGQSAQSHPKCTWAYFSFPATSLTALKSHEDYTPAVVMRWRAFGL